MSSPGGQQNRIVQGEDGRWYFRTRSTGTEGPFVDRRSAKRALDRHIFDCYVRTPGIKWPREWSPMRLLRRAPAEPASNR